jgi:O-antigen/teichoic acid export membrane protein
LTIATFVVGTALAALERLVLARALGAAAFGLYALVLTWIGIIALLPRFGLDIVVLRFAAQYRGQCDWALLRGLCVRALVIAGAASLAVAIILAAVAYRAGLESNPSATAVFAIGAWVLPTLVLGRLLQVMVQAAARPVTALLPTMVLLPIVTIVGVLLLWVQRVTPSAADGMVVRAVSGAFCVLLLALLVRRVAWPRAVEDERTPPCYPTAAWLGTAFPVFWMSGLSVLLAGQDVVMLGWLASATQAGIFAVCSSLAEVVSFGLIAANTLMAPLISSLYHRSEIQALQMRIGEAMRLVAAVAVPAAAVLIGLAEPLLGLFGLEFRSGKFALIVLVAGQLFNALSGSVGYVLTMTGHQNVAAKVMAAAVAMNALLNLALIPRFGMVGAAVASATTVACWNLSLYLLVRRRTGLDTSLLCAFAAAPPARRESSK